MTPDELRVIAAVIDAINRRIYQIADGAIEAQQCIKEGNYLGASGSLLFIERDLEEALTLHRAALALYRRRAP